MNVLLYFILQVRRFKCPAKKRSYTYKNYTIPFNLCKILIRSNYILFSNNYKIYECFGRKNYHINLFFFRSFITYIAKYNFIYLLS
ncbi:hypothetical protein (nucleomorph) [Guillardia theta]|uniref:Uncharacterized protein n=1 Tax=Guillardia theta TaxID=55529 RepID=Q98SA0_GUITH|nr:hypothetical protein GTHECHR3039 [Guillardia theta]AAK39683.1 hypothetical protein [Guillardia theta]